MIQYLPWEVLHIRRSAEASAANKVTSAYPALAFRYIRPESPPTFSFLLHTYLVGTTVIMKTVCYISLSCIAHRGDRGCSVAFESLTGKIFDGLSRLKRLSFHHFRRYMRCIEEEYIPWFLQSIFVMSNGQVTHYFSVDMYVDAWED